MKLSLSLLFAVLLNTLASPVTGQNSSFKIDMKNVIVRDVLKEMENKTGYRFFFSDDFADIYKTVSINVESDDVTELLSQIFQESTITYKILENNVVVITPVKTEQQGITVTGTVIDDQGEPLPGVNIRVQNSITGTTTDVDGRYSIVAPGEQAVLQFSFIGFTQLDVVVGSRQVINITLEEDIQQIDEVVVVGYGTVRKSDVTGAVSRVTENTIRERPVQNALQAMEGRATGVDITSNWRPGEVGTIRIRGNRSIGASNDPLYVLDGIPLISGAITDINPNDIASMEILKDASATAIYGSRAANGVVLITSKKGTKGRTSVNYDGTVTFTKIHSLTDWMNSGELLDWQRQTQLNGKTYAGRYGTAPDPARDFTLFMSNLAYMKRILATAYRLNNDPLGTPDPNNPVLRDATAEEIANGYAAQVPVYDAANLYDQNWTDLITRTGITQNHQISVSAGSDNAKVYLSMAYLDAKAPLKDQSYNRYTLNFNGDITPQKWLNIGVMGNLSRSNQDWGLQNGNDQGAKDSYGQAEALMPYAPAFDENGNLFKPVAMDNMSYDNILNNILESQYNIVQFSMMANIFAEVRFTPWLRYRINYGTQYQNRRTGYFYGPNFSNPWLERPPASPANAGYFLQPTSYSWVVENLLYADKTFGIHTFGATLLQSAQKRHDETINVRAHNLTFPTALWYSLSSNGNSAPFGYGTGTTNTQMMSYMARFNYSLMDKYLLTATARWDGASVLAPGNKWDFFPSVALAWKMEQENFLKSVSWVNQMKLRLGYGVTGNSAVAAYATGGTISAAPYIFGEKTAVPGYRSNGMPNPTLSWEKTAQWNAGIDYGVLKNRLSGSIEFYQSNTFALLLNRSLPATSGFTSIRTNVGKTRNTGVEVTISSVNVKRSDFQWTTTLNWSHNKEEIVELGSGKVDDVANNWFIGYPVSIYRDYKYDRLWQDTPEDQRLMAIYKISENYNYQPGQAKIVDQPFIENPGMKGQDGWKTVTLASGEEVTYQDNGFGVISDTDRKILGTSLPKWIGGLSNTFTYKNFELGCFIYMRVGNMYFGKMQTYGRRRETSVWSPDNTGAKYYQPTSTQGLTNHNNTMNYGNGSFVSVRNISLSYTLPDRYTGAIKAQRAQVYVQLLNPFIFGGEIVQVGLNPEDLTGRSTRTGADNYPQTSNTFLNRSFVAGLRVGF